MSERTRAAGTDWALGIEARSRALLSDGPAAEALYREAIDRLGRTHGTVHLARTQLLYGEWLRREHRRVARGSNSAEPTTRSAAWVPRRSPSAPVASSWPRARRSATARSTTRDALTAQETQIARLAREGRTNPEIGSQLFLSPRTVEWHLRKVFAKLGIRSRKELRTALVPV